MGFPSPDALKISLQIGEDLMVTQKHYPLDSNDREPFSRRSLPQRHPILDVVIVRLWHGQGSVEMYPRAFFPHPLLLPVVCVVKAFSLPSGLLHDLMAFSTCSTP